jgi:hypothetical protein
MHTIIGLTFTFGDSPLTPGESDAFVAHFLLSIPGLWLLVFLVHIVAQAYLFGGQNMAFFFSSFGKAETRNDIWLHFSCSRNIDTNPVFSCLSIFFSILES